MSLILVGLGYLDTTWVWFGFFKPNYGDVSLLGTLGNFGPFGQLFAVLSHYWLL